MLEKHMVACKFSLIPCPKKCKDASGSIKSFMRRDLEKHMELDCPNRDFECKHCGKKGTFADIKLHNKTCPKVYILCPNSGCNTFMPRENIDRHCNIECRFTEIPCKFANIGCKRRLSRVDMKAHEQNNKLHIEIIFSAVARLQESWDNGSSHQVKKLDDINAAIKNLRDSTTTELGEVNTEIEKIRSESSEAVKTLQKKVVELQHAYATVVQMAAVANKALKDEIAVLQGEIATLKDVTSTLSDQNAQLQEKNFTTEPITFAMSGYQQKKDSNEMFTSPSFYTSRKGYCMEVRVYANEPTATSTGSHMSIYTYWLQGKNDNELKWPFIGKVTFTLLNQLEDKNHHQSTMSFTSADNKRVGDGYGYRQFITHSALSRNRFKNTQYLLGDTLYFKVSVEVADHKPWLECTA